MKREASMKDTRAHWLVLGAGWRTSFLGLVKDKIRFAKCLQWSHVFSGVKKAMKREASMKYTRAHWFVRVAGWRTSFVVTAKGKIRFARFFQWSHFSRALKRS